MAITVFEATKLNTFKNFKLISGFSGLDNLLEKVGILDWEFFSNMEGQFINGEFVLTSLLFAKDNPDYIFEAVKSLIKDGACGLAVKNIYYNELPQEVVDYSNEMSFPIFIFDNRVYFEDIITEVADKIRLADNYEILETKIDILIKKGLNKATVKEIAYEINSSFKEQFFVLYCKRKNYFDHGSMMMFLEGLARTKSLDLYSSALKYRNGILVIVTDENMDEKSITRNVSSLMERIGIDLLEYYVGVSNVHSGLGQLDRGINECLFAQKSGEVSNSSMNHFKEIGIYSILMPYSDESWMQDFYNRIIGPIKSYDQKYNTELFETAVRYIENDGKVIETANSFFLHKNTVRYRIGKIKELLNMEDCEGRFYEQLSAAIKLYKIYNI